MATEPQSPLAQKTIDYHSLAESARHLEGIYRSAWRFFVAGLPNHHPEKPYQHTYIRLPTALEAAWYGAVEGEESGSRDVTHFEMTQQDALISDLEGHLRIAPTTKVVVAKRSPEYTFGVIAAANQRPWGTHKALDFVTYAAWEIGEKWGSDFIGHLVAMNPNIFNDELHNFNRDGFGGPSTYDKLLWVKGDIGAFLDDSVRGYERVSRRISPLRLANFAVFSRDVLEENWLLSPSR